MWTVLAVLCLATGALARKQFIVGGSDVDIADYPWQVKKKHFFDLKFLAYLSDQIILFSMDVVLLDI